MIIIMIIIWGEINHPLPTSNKLLPELCVTIMFAHISQLYFVFCDGQRSASTPQLWACFYLLLLSLPLLTIYPN